MSYNEITQSDIDSAVRSVKSDLEYEISQAVRELRGDINRLDHELEKVKDRLRSVGGDE